MKPHDRSAVLLGLTPNNGMEDKDIGAYESTAKDTE